MRRRWFAVAVLALAGCASWHHPHKTVREFHADRSSCLARAGQATGGVFSDLYVDVYQSCMYGEGWTKK